MNENRAAVLASAAAARIVGMAPADETEAARQLGICNACRYCEGFCAVFPAMTRRLQFGPADIHYLANLCHNCGACLHACQYAPPHEFAVNVPRILAKVRGGTYQEHAWPAALAGLYRRNGLTLSLAVALALAMLLIPALGLRGAPLAATTTARFYDVLPHRTLVLMFGTVFGYSMVALAIGVRSFWRSIEPGRAGASALAESMLDIGGLRYLGGGHGEGCNDEDDRFTLRRRRFHHCTFYGFLLCFAATTAATVYHYALGLEAPYGYGSIPVVLGMAGGVGLLIGLSGQLFLNLRRSAEQTDASQRTMDYGFIALLYAITVTGFALLAWRATAAMALLLAAHLAVVMALFLTLPYGKFAHGIYRGAALIKWAIEKRLPNPVGLDD